ncbi:MAG: archaeosine synthase beta-subunit [Archaeoglobi archaeon]|nr:archaeosine biosynthesis radical SAM protein RaSEA [Candidatus Mnemosynella bozhongmuii]MDI3502588.1 archaeosine synthase beta-subunit [Archaeoglobi archaeon]MDK2782384.1 archaeosine synthase beta-subunit [Archaeoglobi archaeon]
MKIKEAQKPARIWRDLDRFDGEILPVVTAIMRTRGCYWNRCTMCGYFEEHAEAGAEDLIRQFEIIERSFPEEDFALKIFTSGSFFDEREIPGEVRREILERCHEHGNLRRVVVESRPEFIKEEVIEEAISIFPELEIGIGLETSDDDVRRICINKGFTFQDFLRASELLKKFGVHLRVYLLLKPPFLSERRAIEDVLNSISSIPWASTISINPLSVHRGTLVERLYRKGEYRPPWLWSVVEVLKRAEKKANIISDPTGGGSKRGAHNCGECDIELLKEIKEFSLTQDESVFQKDCRCREKWMEILEHEDLTFGMPLL